MSKDKVFLKMAQDAGEMSKCPRRKFGALLVNKHGRLVGFGYNGTVTEQPNLCGGDFCVRGGRECESCKNGDCNEQICTFLEPIKSGAQNDIGCIHAEVNLLLNSSLEDLRGGTVYIAGEPCLLCAKFLAQAQIARLVYLFGGYSTSEGLSLLSQCNVQVSGLRLRN